MVLPKKGIDASDKYIECATDDGNIKIIKNKKAGLKEIIKDIESSQALLNEMMTELEDAYKEDRSYKLVFKANKGDSKIKTFFRQVFKSTVNLTSHDNPKTIYVTPLPVLRCLTNVISSLLLTPATSKILL